MLVATGSTNSAQAAQAVTKTIPIVFANGGDPVKVGLVPSLLNCPAGNTTGVSYFNSPLGSKRSELVRNIVPTAAVIGFLLNPNNPGAEVRHRGNIKAAGAVIGAQIIVLKAASEADIDATFAGFVQGRPDAILVNHDALFSSRNDRFAALAARYAIPAIYPQRAFVAAGGLASYGPDIPEGYREAGSYTGTYPQGCQAGRTTCPAAYEIRACDQP